MKNIKKLVGFIFCLLFVSGFGIYRTYAKVVILGFDVETGIHQKTRTFVDPDGYDMDGYKIEYTPDSSTAWDDEGDDDKYGVFDPSHAVLLNAQGCYDYDNGCNRKGFNKDGLYGNTGQRYDAQGYDLYGFDRYGIHKDTKTKWSPYWFDSMGFRQDGFNVFSGGFRQNGLIDPFGSYSSC